MHAEDRLAPTHATNVPLWFRVAVLAVLLGTVVATVETIVLFQERDLPVQAGKCSVALATASLVAPD